MTARQLFEYSLIEINKVRSQSLLLDDYNYFINKAITSYINKKYNLFELNQQLTDDLRVLTKTEVITSPVLKSSGRLQGIAYVGTLPEDYLHLLNCVVEFEDTLTSVDCTDPKPNSFFPVKRATAQISASIINNYYLQPSYKNPYYYIHNSSDPTPSITGIRLKNDRDGNASVVTIEIHCGKNTRYTLEKIYIDYLRVGKFIELTQGEIDADLDTSQILEFPDYVCYEIIKELVALLMENASDPRLNSNIPVNQSIAMPGMSNTQKR